MEGKIPEGLAERRHLVNQLLDAVSHEKGLRVVKIINLYFEQEAQRMLSNCSRTWPAYQMTSLSSAKIFCHPSRTSNCRGFFIACCRRLHGG